MSGTRRVCRNKTQLKRWTYAGAREREKVHNCNFHLRARSSETGETEAALSCALRKNYSLFGLEEKHRSKCRRGRSTLPRRGEIAWLARSPDPCNKSTQGNLSINYKWKKIYPIYKYIRDWYELERLIVDVVEFREMNATKGEGAQTTTNI